MQKLNLSNILIFKLIFRIFCFILWSVKLETMLFFKEELTRKVQFRIYWASRPKKRELAHVSLCLLYLHTFLFLYNIFLFLLFSSGMSNSRNQKMHFQIASGMVYFRNKNSDVLFYQE